MNDVERWLAQCPAAAGPCVDALRVAIRQAGPDLAETIKWNAPSFAQDGQDRITLGLERDGGVRVVLHRGAAKLADGFVFDDRSGLAKWPSPDRGVLKLKDAAAVGSNRPALIDLFSRWLEATR